jgi:formimidoylglutamate deiminase
MLKAGYTQVCEFHYLHQQPDGKPYADPAAMSLALIEAARETGIGLTLLPALYMTGGFDGRLLSERQRRFGHDVESYLRLVEQLCKMEDSTLRIGIALHSLRAVPEEAMSAAVDWVAREGIVAAVPAAIAGQQPVSSPRQQLRPIHIHIAEQIGEVQDCLALRNARPVEWLLENAPVAPHWCLVHATHMTADETRRLAESGAVVGLCPTTEANLGDGVFPLKAYLEADGTFGIGSDSHISVSPVEELRWLEYGQRLSTRHRNIAVSESSYSVGETLWGDALFGGTQVSGVSIGVMEGDDPASSGASSRADLLVLDHESPVLAGRDTDSLIDTFLFAGNTNLVRHVMVNGDWVVNDFRHRDEERITARYRETAQRLAQSI